MEESKEQKSLFRLLQFAIYLSVLLEIYLIVIAKEILVIKYSLLINLNYKILSLPIYTSPITSKLFTLCLVALVSIGTLSKKKVDLNPQKHILYPLILGFFLLVISIWAYYNDEHFNTTYKIKILYITYAACSLIGIILLHIALSNISKIINSNLGKDRWNVEQESFLQQTKTTNSPYSINIPMLYYYKRKINHGYITLENLFRGLLVCGVPGSGKSFGVIMPIIRQMIHKSFTMCLYDLKYPDLGKIAYYHYSKMHEKGYEHNFHVINLNLPHKSRRVNPFKSEYLRTLADATETAEALVEALKKGDKSAGSDQFFTQSAINFLAACIYFFSKHKEGKYSSLPHVLAFLNLSYDQIFTVLFSNNELASLLSPFMSAYKAKAFDQLEGQVGTLKIFISRMATKETFWVFSGDDFDLHISSPKCPSILVLANDPSTQSINSACLSIVLNRVTRLINTKGNLPVGVVVDEAPSVYIHKIEVLLAQARSNLSAVVLGIQELPMLRQQYGKEAADTIIAIMGNIISGAVRSKDTLEWLERLFGKVKQQGESLSIDRTKTSISVNEKLEPLIPAGKIASLSAGEVVGILARDRIEKFTGEFQTTAINCRINLNLKELQIEEKNYIEMPQYYDFGDKQEEILLENYSQIIQEVNQMVNQIIPN
ncbi:type IV secretion system DNA-binding domain-containing protein [Sphingobacterium bovistauri]|uniref:Type IV secretion system DNA-binding domain-containing protein n=1 Tax=Sphingobacterium bovistauri TaxID=2781959 RepID=A0ABS7Z1M9_9SPHI|nr:type IV secretion system DNA-binding domain-containing protein [Sphingobacterium bovistauri]MCA5004036.1 type IV secretion system DNA-binding domain-containing protein [Sphingobacterium bovistauri]